MRIGQGLARRLRSGDHAGFGGVKLSGHDQGFSLSSGANGFLGRRDRECSRLRWWISGQSRRHSAVRTRCMSGTLRPWQILIPPGVGHGYKVIGREPAMLVYVTNKFYNPKDEGRIAYNEPGIAYDWELQHK